MFVEQVVQMNTIELHLEIPLGQKMSDCGSGYRMLSMGRWLGLLVELNSVLSFTFDCFIILVKASKDENEAQCSKHRSMEA